MGTGDPHVPSSIADPFNSQDNNQNDDLARLSSVSCGSVWGQTFSYDPFGNTMKMGSSSWQPLYNTKNQYQALRGYLPQHGFPVFEILPTGAGQASEDLLSAIAAQPEHHIDAGGAETVAVA